MIKAFFKGMAEFRQSLTTRFEDDKGVAYDKGRDFAHRLTGRRYDN